MLPRQLSHIFQCLVDHDIMITQSTLKSNDFFKMLRNGFLNRGSSHSSEISAVNTRITMTAQSESHSARHCAEQKLSVFFPKEQENPLSHSTLFLATILKQIESHFRCALPLHSRQQ